MQKQVDNFLYQEYKTQINDLINEFETTSGINIAQEHQNNFSLTLFCSLYFKSCMSKEPEIYEKLVQIPSKETQEDIQKEFNQFAQKLSVANEQKHDTLLNYKIIRKYKTYKICQLIYAEVNQLLDEQALLNRLSYLADVLIEYAYNQIKEKLSLTHGIALDSNGVEQKLMIVALGKLGGMELNLSSDIDLIFLYNNAGKTSKSNLDLAYFFTLFIREFIDILTKTTEDGFGYRVDVRLRPHGSMGPMVCSLTSLENYLISDARSWERYALIKARVVNQTDSNNEFYQLITPFIYRKYIDFSTLDTLRELKKTINKDLFEKFHNNDKNNIKLSFGGIREIEFIVQSQQILNGGRNKFWQQQSIFSIFEYMSEMSIFKTQELDIIKNNYLILRRVENLLQAYDNKQTHIFNPKDSETVTRLALAFEYENVDHFVQMLEQKRSQIHSIFNELIGKDSQTEDPLINTILEFLQNTHWQDSQQYSDIELFNNVTLEKLEKLNASLVPLREKLNEKIQQDIFNKKISYVSVEVIKICINKSYDLQIVPKMLELLFKISTRKTYISLLYEKKNVLEFLISLITQSDWVYNQIIQFPYLLDSLISAPLLVSPIQKNEYYQEYINLTKKVPFKDDIKEFHINELNFFKHINQFLIACSDLTDNLKLMNVSDCLTFLAESIIEVALSVAWQFLTEKHGYPSIQNDNNKTNLDKPYGFIVVAYGKLGGIELSYGSDLDLVFLYETENDKMTDGKESIENQFFYLRLQQILQTILNTSSLYGKLYEVDNRLRPYGNQGTFAVSFNEFFNYQKDTAWSWEHQALIKTRAVAGDENLMNQYNQKRIEFFSHYQCEGLKAKIHDIRQKMNIKKNNHQQKVNLKLIEGGIVDIEFIVQYLFLTHTHQFPSISKYTDNIRILNSLFEQGVIDDEDKDMLQGTYIKLRNQVHKENLHYNDSSQIHDKEGIFFNERNQVSWLYNKYFLS